MMIRETPFIFLLMRLISILTVFYLPSLGNLLINKGNPFRDNLCFRKDMLQAHKDNTSKDNLRPSQGMSTTHKENPYRDNLRSRKDCFTDRKGSVTILKVNLCQPSL